MNHSKAVPSPIYVLMAMLFVVTAIAGFGPTSLRLISRVASEQQLLPPFIVHLHAASMSLWLLLLPGQSILMYKGMPQLHKSLGLVSVLLAPCILASMYLADISNIERAGLSDLTGQPWQVMRDKAVPQLMQHAAAYLFFPLFYLWAILVRQTDAESHKRMIILTTLVLMIPAISRLLGVSQVLPDLGLNYIDTRHFYLLVLIAPALFYDVFKRGIPHRSYVIGVTLLGIWMVSAHFLWESTWWVGFAPRFLGVEGE